MATTYKTPGVYIEEIPKLPPSVVQVETSIAAFIGYTQTASKEGKEVAGIPTLISSLVEFERVFGGPYAFQPGDIHVIINTRTKLAQPMVSFTKMFYLFDAVRLFFDNGGSKCFVVSAGSYNDAIFVDGSLASGNQFAAALHALEALDEPTLLVVPDAMILEKQNAFDLQQAMLAQAASRRDRFALLDLKENDTPDFDACVTEFRAAIGTANLSFGAAYAPWLITSYPRTIDTSVFANNIIDHNGTPINIRKITSSIVDRITSAIRATLSLIPPGGAIAGICARVDGTRGVWKAPANEPVQSVVSPRFEITQGQQNDLNVDPVSGKSINVIRTFTGKGTLVWGARTLAGNDNEWRYVSVRRFFSMVEESCRKASERFVFEPNDAHTWVRIQGMIENYLTALWRQGALQGTKPQEAFYVAIGLGKTMTALDIQEGRLIIEIGMAAVRPAEFIILRIMHKMMAE